MQSLSEALSYGELTVRSSIGLVFRGPPISELPISLEKSSDSRKTERTCKTVGAVYDRPRCLGSDIVGGHRPPLQWIILNSTTSGRLNFSIAATLRTGSRRNLAKVLPDDESHDDENETGIFAKEWRSL